jgi:O-antigen ligase
MNSLAYATVWCFVFSLPWEGLIRLSGTAAVTRATGAVALVFTIISVVMAGRFRRLHPLHLAAFAFMAAVTINQLMFHYHEAIPNKFWTFVRLASVLWIIWELAPSFTRVLGLFTAYVLGAYVAAIQTVLVARNSGEAARRFAAGEVDPNDLAMILALSLPMAWYLGMTYHRPILRWVFRAYIPLGLVAIGLTGSRGGMLTTMVALLIIPLSMTRLTAGQLFVAIALLCISGGLAVKYVPEQVVERLATTGTEVQDMRLGGRFKIWVAGFNAFTRRPVMGYGTSSFIGAVKPELGRQALVAHNSYLSVLVEQGLVGFICFGLMFLTVFRAVLGLPPPERRFALILLATLAIAMLPLTWEDHKPVWFILAALAGLSSTRVTRRVYAQQRPRRAVPSARSATPPWVREPMTAPGRVADQGPAR